MAEISSLLGLITDDQTRQALIAQMENMFDNAPDEERLIQEIGNPTKVAVALIRYADSGKITPAAAPVVAPEQVQPKRAPQPRPRAEQYRPAAAAAAQTPASAMSFQGIPEEPAAAPVLDGQFSFDEQPEEGYYDEQPADDGYYDEQPTDDGYKVAFSVDVNGNDIYTEGMSADDKYAAAKQAALGYFEAAGYTVADGKITAAPAGGRMDAEVMVGGSGKGDHPSFMALTLASDALKEIGFNLIVSDMSNFAEMTNAINAGTADMFAMAWQATPDPDMFQIYHSQGGSNEKSYWIKDADLDELIMMARQSTDQTYRKTLYKQCLDIVADWAVEIPIYQRQNCVIFSAKRVNLDTVTPDITTYWTWYNDIELLDLQ